MAVTEFKPTCLPVVWVYEYYNEVAVQYFLGCTIFLSIIIIIINSHLNQQF